MTFTKNQIHKAVNWNKEDDGFTQAFWDQNVKQFWLPEEISVSKDLKVWNELSDKERELYKKVFGGLTLLDITSHTEHRPAQVSGARKSRVSKQLGTQKATGTSPSGDKSTPSTQITSPCRPTACEVPGARECTLIAGCGGLRPRICVQHGQTDRILYCTDDTTDSGVKHCPCISAKRWRGRERGANGGREGSALSGEWSAGNPPENKQTATDPQETFL